MDFQSAARFGERRVMVTDYDETAVKVNAKVVDEDTRKVICESGGGESDFTVTQITVTNNAPVGLALDVASVNTEDEASGTSIQVDVSNTHTIDVILYKGAANYTFTGAESEYIYNLTGDIKPSPFGGVAGVIRGRGTITISSK